jgi:hypothetical protein
MASERCESTTIVATMEGMRVMEVSKVWPAKDD